MIRRAGEYKSEQVKGLKDGKGEVKVVNFFEMEDFNGKGRLYGKSVIGKGSSIGYHKHEGDQEAYYILKGRALYNDNGSETILEPGDFAICRDGDYHSIESIGDEDLEYIMLILYV